MNTSFKAATVRCLNSGLALRHRLCKLGPCPTRRPGLNLLQERLLKISAMSPAQHYTDYKVGPEDAIKVDFFGMGTSSAPPVVTNAGTISAVAGATDQMGGVFRVNGQGEIRLMLVGTVNVAGLSPVEIAEKLSQTLQRRGLPGRPADHGHRSRIQAQRSCCFRGGEDPQLLPPDRSALPARCSWLWLEGCWIAPETRLTSFARALEPVKLPGVRGSMRRP